MTKIYLASSWRNVNQPLVVAQLRAAGFRADGFGHDMRALSDCDVCVLLLPCGKSAHLELGWAAGAGKRTYVLLAEGCEPELMYKMCGKTCLTVEEVVAELRADEESDASPINGQDLLWP